VLDEVWAPSHFVQRIYQQAYDIPITWVGKGFDLPPPAPFDLARLGIRPEQPAFLLSFDLHSSVARKNPLAAVHAFQMAFEGNPEARLIIKTSKPPKKHWGDPEKQMLIIKKLMARDPRIILFQEHLPFADYLGLIKAATALVSPHRSEGFGYVPAYAMALGTPVIATDYAGTQDFCTNETALAVPWRKRLVRPGESIFPLENTHWAEIDHEALATAMQEIVNNPAAAARRAAMGKALMRETYSQAALRQRYKARLSELGVI
jgi:glycosyltransferase involved in cell wall biosynthesis